MQCTTYCKKRWNQEHDTRLPNDLPHARDWYEYEFDYPIRKSQTTYSNSVACFSGGQEGLGHVIFIEKAYSDGSFYYTESNCGYTGHGNGGPSDKIFAEDIQDFIDQHPYDGFIYEGCIYIKGAPNVGA